MKNAHFCYDPIAEEREIKQLEARSEFRNEALKKKAEVIDTSECQECFDNLNELTIVDELVKNIEEDLETERNIDSVILAEKEYNSVLQGCYHNTAEEKPQLIKILKLASLKMFFSAHWEEQKGKIDDFYEKTDGQNLPAVENALVENCKKFKSFDADTRLIVLQKTASARKNLDAKYFSALSVCKNLLGVGIAALILGVILFIVGCATMGIFVFLGIVSIVAGIICLGVRKNKKYTFEEISKECRETKGLLANITSLASMEAIKGSSLYDEVMRELDTKHKAALNKIESYGLRKNVKEKLAQLLAPYEEKKKYWEEAKGRIESVRQEENKKMEIFSEFSSLIPKEFWNDRALYDASDLLNGSRADNLKEAFTLLENRYREERRDQEQEAFRQQQTEYQRQQAASAAEEAEYQRQQARAAERTAEYQRQQAASAAEEAEYQRQQARAAESAAEYQRQQVRAAERTAEYQRQQVRAAERTAASAASAAEAARRSAAANEENARRNR